MSGEQARTPEPTSWLLSGSVSALLIALLATIVSLADHRTLADADTPPRGTLASG